MREWLSAMGEALAALGYVLVLLLAVAVGFVLPLVLAAVVRAVDVAFL